MSSVENVESRLQKARSWCKGTYESHLESIRKIKLPGPSPGHPFRIPLGAYLNWELPDSLMWGRQVWERKLHPGDWRPWLPSWRFYIPFHWQWGSHCWGKSDMLVSALGKICGSLCKIGGDCKSWDIWSVHFCLGVWVCSFHWGLSIFFPGLNIGSKRSLANMLL